MSKSILVIAGEVSGDIHVAKIIWEIREKNSSIHFWGIAGEASQEAGTELIHHTKKMAVMGLTEVLRQYRFFKNVFDEMIYLARKRKPDAVLLVDYPGFNLRFARKVHAMGLKVIYYVCPQVWAWKRSRIQKMAKVIDRLLVIFPFEEKIFKGTGLNVNFVGHPLVEEAKRVLAGPETKLPWQGQPQIALLPGSRRQEIERILPVMWKAAVLIGKKYPGSNFIIAAPSKEVEAIIKKVLEKQSGGSCNIQLVTGQTRHVLRQARAAWVTSGTATIEAALMQCPMVVVYKTSFFTYMAARMLIQIPYIGMVNIVAEKQLCPELVQHHATPLPLVEALGPLLEETKQRAEMIQGLDQVAQALGEKGNTRRAVDIILETVDGSCDDPRSDR
ncbi:MAG: lipid-A-disaccharide synthase [Kiritimatiellae bacterium]|nr:lipid-A-disaccharide synthase [Kiritimatiellia bacterium]